MFCHKQGIGLNVLWYAHSLRCLQGEGVPLSGSSVDPTWHAVARK